MTIDFPAYDYTTFDSKLDSYDVHSSKSIGSNAFGVKRIVTSYTENVLRAKFIFPKGSLPSKLEIRMTPTEAAAFKSVKGRMLFFRH